DFSGCIQAVAGRGKITNRHSKSSRIKIDCEPVCSDPAKKTPVLARVPISNIPNSSFNTPLLLSRLFMHPVPFPQVHGSTDPEQHHVLFRKGDAAFHNVRNHHGFFFQGLAFPGKCQKQLCQYTLYYVMRKINFQYFYANCSVYNREVQEISRISKQIMPDAICSIFCSIFDFILRVLGQCDLSSSIRFSNCSPCET
ncbi:MAG: hypothetical protein IIY71_01700, partial [Oscillospiraceae bacterium]|nr:hypothetical protein [Oscillospiraceae bacterium]